MNLYRSNKLHKTMFSIFLVRTLCQRINKIWISINISERNEWMKTKTEEKKNTSKIIWIFYFVWYCWFIHLFILPLISWVSFHFFSDLVGFSFFFSVSFGIAVSWSWLNSCRCIFKAYVYIVFVFFSSFALYDYYYNSVLLFQFSSVN